MKDFIIDPETVNPAYPRPLTLEDVHWGAELLTFDTRNGAMSTATVAEDWRAEERVVVVNRWKTRTLISVPELVAKDARGRTLSLSRRGIHPLLGDGNWYTGRFSVAVTQEDIVSLYGWLEDEGYPRAARKLESHFPERFGVDWDQLLALHA